MSYDIGGGGAVVVIMVGGVTVCRSAIPGGGG